jgi:hypothetical protein
MEELERDSMVIRWTRHHGIRVSYRKWWGGSGFYEPDFLVELIGGGRELREVKGEHLFRDANTARKLRAGENHCRQQGLVFRVVTKSAVDPAIWSPGVLVAVVESQRGARPALAEDAHGDRSGCLGAMLAIILLGLGWAFG